jgi:hypothetical protein
MATCVQEIHLGDIGTVFEVELKDCTTVVDLSTATIMEILFQKPDGTTVTKSAEFTTDGADGKIRYITVANDIDVTGSWKLQARVTLPTGTWSSNIEKFKVYGNL